MKTIDLQTWPRRKHYEMFRGYDYPHFNLCAPVDVTRIVQVVKEQAGSFTIAVIFLLSRVANRREEFRLRIRGESVVEHESVHPAPTILTGEDLFSFYAVQFVDDYSQFRERTRAAIEHARGNPSLEDEPGRDDWLFMTAIPWVAFSSMVHPIHMHPVDSIPRLAWGRHYSEGDRLKMTLSVQVHHALMDGIHIGRFFEAVQADLDEPGWLC